MKLDAAGHSHSGRSRPSNEDALLVRADKGIFAVADGMGGHLAGEVASRLAVEMLDAAMEGALPARDGGRALADRLVDAARSANEAILERGREDPSAVGLGTTLTALGFAHTSDEVAIAHMGDSRAYRLRAGRLRQLTRDHTWVQDEVDAGRITPERARGHPHANLLSRVLGMPDVGEADRYVLEAAPGDVYLLCSDGLTSMLEDVEIEAIIARDAPASALAAQLISAANARGGIDNITAVVVRVA